MHGLAHHRVIGDLDGAGDVLLAGCRSREQRCHQVVRLHALDRRRVLTATTESQDDQRTVEVPAPTRQEHRLIQNCLGEGVADVVAVDETDHVAQRKAVVRSEGDDHGVIVGRCLELEVEAPTELLAQGIAHCPVDTPAPWRVDDELHAAGLVEEPFQHQVVLRRQ